MLTLGGAASSVAHAMVARRGGVVVACVGVALFSSRILTERRRHRSGSTLRFERKDSANDDVVGIDDDLHAACSEYVSDSRISAATCSETDNRFCETVRDDWLGGSWSLEFNRTGCAVACGREAFGPCLLKALSGDVQQLCNGTVFDDRRGPSAEARDEAADASSASEAPTPAPSDYLFYEFPDCDIHTYCKNCAFNSTCNTIVQAAQRGRIPGIREYKHYLADAHGWHAGQAAVVVQHLPALCEALPSLLGDGAI